MNKLNTNFLVYNFVKKDLPAINGISIAIPNSV